MTDYGGQSMLTGLANSSVTIDSGRSDHAHHYSLLVISAKRPTQEVLDEIMSPWIADPPWANKLSRLVGYALGGDYRGWLIPLVDADTITSARSYPAKLFHSDGVDAVRVHELQSAERCSRWRAKSKTARQRNFRIHTAPRCNVLAPQECVITGAEHWRNYYPECDRPCGLWLRVNEGSCDNHVIAKIIGDVPNDYWLAVVDCWSQWAG